MKYTQPMVRSLARTPAAYCSTGSSATLGGETTTDKFCQSGGDTTNPGGNSLCITGGVASPYSASACSDGSAPGTSGVETCTNGNSAASGGTSNNCGTGGDFL